MDVLDFAMALSFIARGQSPQEVCSVYGTSFQKLRQYAEDHQHSDDLMQALEMGANEDEEEACGLEDRGECSTCAE